MKTFPDFIENLSDRLTGPLPGLASQLKMAGTRRILHEGRPVIPADAKHAGVLILFYPVNSAMNIVFMKRTEYPGVHSGQISFPGGGREPHDTDIVETALRETEEEIGINREDIILIGKLTELFIPPSNFLVTPIVGYTAMRPEFKPDSGEVDRIIEIPVDLLLKENTKQTREITVFPDMKLKVPCFYIDGDVIWGATAMILNELLEVISQGS